MDKKQKSSSKALQQLNKSIDKIRHSMSTRSCKNVNNLALNNTQSLKDSEITSAGPSTSKKKSGMTKFQSAMNIHKNDSSKVTSTESSSSRPFPKMDHEFYDEKKNYFWQKEIKKIKSEKSIFSSKISLRKDLVEKSHKMVYESNVFEPKTTKNSGKKPIDFNKTKKVQVDLSQPLQKSLIEIQRERMFHAHVSVMDPNYSKNYEDQSRKKTVSPMHVKMYESSLSKNLSQKVNVPRSHPTYNKDPTEKPKVPPSTRKRLEFLKTSYNFTKSYV